MPTKRARTSKADPPASLVESKPTRRSTVTASPPPSYIVGGDSPLASTLEDDLDSQILEVQAKIQLEEQAIREREERQQAAAIKKELLADLQAKADSLKSERLQTERRGGPQRVGTFEEGGYLYQRDGDGNTRRLTNHGNFSLPPLASRPSSVAPPLGTSAFGSSPAPVFDPAAPAPFPSLVLKKFNTPKDSLVDIKRHLIDYDNAIIIASSHSGKHSGVAACQSVAAVMENIRKAIDPLAMKFKDVMNAANELYSIAVTTSDHATKLQLLQQIDILLDIALSSYDAEQEIVKSFRFSLHLQNLIQSSGVQKALDFSFGISMQPNKHQDPLDQSLKDLYHTSSRFEIKKPAVNDRDNHNQRGKNAVQAYCPGCKNNNVYHTFENCKGLLRNGRNGAEIKKADPTPTLPLPSVADPKPS